MRWLALLFLSMIVATSAGCVSTPRIPGVGGLGEKTKEIINESKGVMWPLYFSGFLLIIGGAVYGVFFKDFRFLLLGIGVALVPPLFIIFLAPIAIYVGYLVLFCGVMGVGFVGYRIYDYIKDQEHEREFHDSSDHGNP